MATSSSINKTVLDNGIRVLSERVPYVDSVSVGVWISAGSRDEEAGRRGVSHFLEHMLFKGTEKRTARQIADEMDLIGGHLNAFTDREHTCYFAKVLAEHLSVALDLISDMVFHSLLDPDEIEREKRVVLEEIKRYQDTPEESVHDLFAEVLWHRHALGKPVVGSRTDVAKLDRDWLQEYLDAFYTPDAVVVAAAGNLEHSRLVQLAEKTFGWPRGRRRANGYSEVKACRARRFKRKSIAQVHFCIGTPGYAQNDDRKYTLAVIDSILGGGMSSRLFQEIRENRGLAYSIGSYSASYENAGMFAIYGGTSPENLDEVIKLIKAECVNLRDRNVTDAEMQRGKNQIRGALVLAQESMSNRMNRLAKSELYFGRTIPTQEIVQRIMAVTKDDIDRVAHELFGEPEFAFAAIGPFGRDGRCGK